MADPSTKQREMASLYVFAAALKGQELNIPDHKHFDDAQGPERPALIDQGIRDIWTDTKIRSGGLKMEDVFSYKHQGKVLVDYLKDRGAHGKRNKWKYGRFDGTQGVNSPLELDTDILDKIWDLFDSEHRQLFSNKKSGQKDSWNPADVYLYDGDDNKILNQIKELKKKTDKTENPRVFVALVNDYLTQLFIENTLIGISLKQATPPNEPVAKGINIVRDQDFEGPKFGEAKLIKGSNGYVHQYMEVSKKNGKLDFKGNSITFECEVSMDGGEPLKYFWESKSPPETRPHVTEMKDMVPGGRNNSLKKANARGGSISKDLQFEPLVKEFTGKGWNNRVPTSVLSESQIKTAAKYWSAYYLTLKKSPLITLNDVEIKNSKGETMYSNGTRGGTIRYFEELFWIDQATQKQVEMKYGMKKSDKWTQNFRGKLRGMIIMRSVWNADKAGRLGEFLVRAYYSAGKMKFRADDLQGPFVKIQ
tara:strand:+ start:108 stop:1538 length:1431 start_codon:yes stop_codon:yes gene_type:complete